MPVMELWRRLPDPEPFSEGMAGTTAALRVTTAGNGGLMGQNKTDEKQETDGVDGESSGECATVQ